MHCVYFGLFADRYVRDDESIAATAHLHIHLMLPLSFPVSRRLTVARACAVAALCMVPVSTALTNVFCALFAVALIASPEFWGNLRLSVSNGASLAALLLLGALVLVSTTRLHLTRRRGVGSASTRSFFFYLLRLSHSARQVGSRLLVVPGSQRSA